jgi:hypothetical protein
MSRFQNGLEESILRYRDHAIYCRICHPKGHTIRPADILDSFSIRRERQTVCDVMHEESSVHDAMKIDFHILRAQVECYIMA